MFAGRRLRTPGSVEPLKLADGEVHAYLEHASRLEWPGPLYDYQPECRWRHTCRFKTILHVEPPRTNCGEHCARTVKLPWAEPDSRFTALFGGLRSSG